MTAKDLVKIILPKFVLKVYHYKLALLGAFLFGFSGYSKKMKVIGVTGTSGKSTTVDFITKILEEAGNRVASISTVRLKIGDKEWENKYKMSMPGRFVIQQFLRQAVKAGCQFVVLEVTSEGIRQFRNRFINFDAAVFTNLTPEHIESHGGFEKYRNEKIKLFKKTKNIHVINADDENAKYFLEVPSLKKIKFSAGDAEIVSSEDKIKFIFRGTNFVLNLLGQFNIYNALAAVSLAQAYNIDLEICKSALEKVVAIQGRMEIISDSPVKVVVDYAHTPEQLEAVYKTLQSGLTENGKMICVLGSCGGGRDKWKRPVLGKISSKYCDDIFITNEDPYDEDPNQILSEIKAGVSHFEFSTSNMREILDRRKAIKSAIEAAKNGDTVIITGKGSEPWMCLENGRKIPWDDREIAREFLK